MTNDEALRHLIGMAEEQGRYWRGLQRSAKSLEDKTTFAVKAEPWEDAARNARAAIEALSASTGAVEAEREAFSAIEQAHDLWIRERGGIGMAMFEHAADRQAAFAKADAKFAAAVSAAIRARGQS